MSPKTKTLVRLNADEGFYFYCARDRSRTDTSLRTADFESAASTNSATRAGKASLKFKVLSLRLLKGKRLSERGSNFKPQTLNVKPIKRLQCYVFEKSCPKCVANIFSDSNSLLLAAALFRNEYPPNNL